MNTKIIISLITLVGIAACAPESEDSTLARCDRIAEKKVEFFSDKDNEGTLRQAFLSTCVLGPDKSYTEHGQTWIDCMDASVTGAELSNCEKVFEHSIKMDKIAEVRKATEKGIQEYLCDSPDEDKVKATENAIQALHDEAKALGAEESEIPTISEISGEIGSLDTLAEKQAFCDKDF